MGGRLPPCVLHFESFLILFYKKERAPKLVGIQDRFVVVVCVWVGLMDFEHKNVGGVMWVGEK